MNRQNTMEWLLDFVKNLYLSGERGGMRRMSISGHFGDVCDKDQNFAGRSKEVYTHRSMML